MDDTRLLMIANVAAGYSALGMNPEEVAERAIEVVEAIYDKEVRPAVAAYSRYKTYTHAQYRVGWRVSDLRDVNVQITPR